MITDKKVTIEQTAGAVLFRRRGDEILYLLLQYPQGHWSFPRGHIEGGETPLETVRREVKEEANISRIRFFSGYKEKVHFRYQWPPKSAEAESRLKFAVYYLGQVFDSRVKISGEHKSFRWATYEHAYKMLRHKNMRVILEKAHAVVVRNKYKLRGKSQRSSPAEGGAQKKTPIA